ncbi:ATP-dependent RNA helicase DHX30 [Mantella aurantiaca]
MAASWNVTPLVSRLLYRVSGQQIRVLCARGERLTSQSGEDMRKDSRDLLKQFPKPKELLQNALTDALRNSNIKNKLSYITAASDQDCRVILRLKWPKPIEVEGRGEKRGDAECHAAAQVCKIFQDLGLLDSGGRHRLPVPRPGISSAAALDEEEDEDGGGRRRKKIRSVRTENRLAAIDNDEDLEAMTALKEFPNPKHLLSNVLQVATSGSKDLIHYQFKGGHIKTCHLNISWPQPLTFIAHDRNRIKAMRKAAALACQKLKDLGLLDPNNKPLTNAMYNQSAIKSMRERQRRPRRFEVAEDLLVRMENYFQEFPMDHSTQESDSESDMLEYSSKSSDEGSDCGAFSDPITGQPYSPFSVDQSEEISALLEAKWRSSQTKPLQHLPVDDHKDAILEAIDGNPIVMIAGDTGCGKTTRIPRFILEDAILGRRGAACNILVTQPRRISAVSVAHRVGQELGPVLRRNVGYHVRLDSMLPSRGGAMLFCTVGILLKKLQTNAGLEGVSHVIVDEVHERDVNTDFLFILLKQVRELNPATRVILMSATGDNQRISQYFGGCPIVRVPGFMHPVTQHYLEDVLAMIGSPAYRPPEVRPPLSRHAASRTGEGKNILCFLPGWSEIREVSEILQGALPDEDGEHLILPVHSNIPLARQQSIFQRPPDGVRKIVLATNIAETSVTIDDIVHVVDSGMQKEQRYDLRTKVSCLETTWVSKSNVIQRRGRAGRCQPGSSYHLFTRQQYQEMSDFQLPEILRTPLENLVLQAKIHTPEMTAVEFLSQALECPERSAIQDAVQLLQNIKVLDEGEELTLLGQRVSQISTDPSLAKAIVLSAIFRCLHPLLTIVACLTRDPFLGGIVNRAEVNKVKEMFSGDTCSDHMAYVRILRAWKAVIGRRDGVTREDFLRENVLSKSSLSFIQGLVSQFSSNAQEALLVSDHSECAYDGALCNQLSQQDEVVKGVLLAGLYPNLIQVRHGTVLHGKLRPNSLEYKTKGGGQVLLHKSTVNRDKQRFRSPWLTYFQAVKSTGAVFVRDSSMVHPLAVLLMTDCAVTAKVNGDIMTVYLSDSDLVKVESDVRTMQLLGALRMALRGMVARNLDDTRSPLSAYEEQQHTELLSILTDLLNATAESFRDPPEAEQ